MVVQNEAYFPIVRVMVDELFQILYKLFTSMLVFNQWYYRAVVQINAGKQGYCSQSFVFIIPSQGFVFARYRQ